MGVLRMPPLPPALWLSDRRSYRVHMPHDLTVVAACEQVGCRYWREGWETVCDESDTAPNGGAAVAMLIRSGQTGRDYLEMKGTRDGTAVTVFRFARGQRCFAEHRTRPGRLLVQRRGRILREHTSLAFLAEDYTEHMGRLAGEEKKG